MTTHRFELFADYHQFVLLDGLDRALPEDVTDEDTHRRLSVGPGVVVVHTARNMMVPVTVELVAEAPPSENLAAWDHVTECDLTIETGHLVLAGLSHIMATAPHIPLAEGSYRLRVHHARLGSLSADGL
ncbi:MAG: hypothetical protein ACRCUX_12850, partial [Beijerinckiaceae bacterium]